MLAYIEAGEWEGYTVTVYERGRLIYLENDKIYLFVEEAKRALKQYYPHATLTTYEVVEKFYREEGYYYPLLRYGKTSLLCHKCNCMLIIDKDSRGVNNAPHGQMYHIWYTCSNCNRVYSNERIVGNITYNGWDYQDTGDTKFTECNQPEHIPYSNSYGFREKMLLKRGK